MYITKTKCHDRHQVETYDVRIIFWDCGPTMRHTIPNLREVLCEKEPGGRISINI